MSSWALTLPPFFSLCLSLCLAHADFAQQPGNASPASESRASSLRQNAAAALNSLGVLHFERQEFDKAMAAFQDALKYDPENYNIRTNLAMVFYQRHQFGKVIETLGSASEQEQTDRRALTALAVSCFALGKFSQAAPLYEKLVGAMPDDVVLRLTLAAVYRLSNHPDQAENVLKQLPGDDRTQAQFHVILADAHRSQLHVKEAIGEYEEALALNPTLPEVNYRLGVLYSDLRLYEQAREAFERELRISPSGADAAYSLGAYFLNYGNDTKTAAQYFEKTIQLNPGHLGGYLGLIKIQLGLGNPAEALRLAEKAQANGGENDELHYLKSRAYNLQGRKDLAEQELKRFEELRSIHR